MSDVEIDEGECTAINYTVENSGSDAEVFRVLFDIDADGDASGPGVVDVDVHRLEEGQTNRGTLVWVTEEGDAGDYVATVDVPAKDESSSYTVAVSALAGMIDDFEEGTLSPYTIGTGDSGHFTFDSETPPDTDSTQSLRGDATSVDSAMASMPGDGLNYYPEPGDTIAAHLRSTDTSRTNIWFGLQSTDADGQLHEDGYRLSFGWWNSTLFLDRYDDFSGTTIAEVDNAEIERDGTWWYFELEWGENGEMDVEIWESDDRDGSPVHTMNANDDTYTDGGVGYSCNNNRSEFWIDEFEAK